MDVGKPVNTRGDCLLNPETLVEEAEASGHREACKILERNPSYRIGVGVRIEASGNHSFFIEILVYLYPASGSLDLKTLGKCVALLKELDERGYFLACQDGGCVSCEKTVPAEKLAEEYAAVKSLTEAVILRLA